MIFGAIDMEETSCAAAPVCCLHRLPRACPAGPLDVEGIAEQRLLELAGGRPERRGGRGRREPQMRENLSLQRESAGARNLPFR